MKKKIKDLTPEERNKICASHTRGYAFCDCENNGCPLWFASTCLKGFIEKLQYVQKEVEVDE